MFWMETETLVSDDRYTYNIFESICLLVTWRSSWTTTEITEDDRKNALNYRQNNIVDETI